MAEVTRILSAIEAGDPKAAADLVAVVYDELRRLAAARMAGEGAGHTLQPTALVHEAYLRLVGGDWPHDWHGRGHYFAAAAEAMRRLLVESARRKQCARCGDDRGRLRFDELTLPAADHRAAELLALDEALTAFAHEEPAKAELVKLRYFAGLTLEEAAACLGIAPATARRHWALARAWLFAALTDGLGPPV